MATTEIFVKAPTIVVGAVTPEITVGIPTYNTVAYSPTEVSLNTSINFEGINVAINGLGEESIVEPTLFKYNEDIKLAIDTPSKQYGKLALDSFSKSDTNSLLYQKAVLETENFSELIITTWNIVREYTDTFNDSDVISFDFDKPLFDSYSKTDSVILLNTFFREYSELIDATDDVLGEANIDDDQYMLFNKGIVDYGTTTEDTIFLWNILRSYYDTTSTTDSRSILLSTVYSDQYSYDDTIGLALTKPFTDSFGDSDSIVLEWDANREISESLYDSETITILVNKSYNDSVLDIDTVEIDFEKPILDSVSDSDLLTISSSKVALDSFNDSDTVSLLVDFIRDYSDSITITDDVLGAANIDDDQYALVNKSIVETCSESDTTSLFLGIPKSDSFVNSQYVVISKQDYHSQDFVSAGYVGLLYIV